MRSILVGATALLAGVLILILMLTASMLLFDAVSRFFGYEHAKTWLTVGFYFGAFIVASYLTGAVCLHAKEETK